MASNYESQQSTEPYTLKRRGFECEFITPPPRGIQTECPICLHIIRDPHTVICCCNSFCRVCILAIKAENKPCPICKKENFVDFQDKRLKPSLYELKVQCSHQKDGCEWTGELRQLDEHLNTDPLPEKQLDGCQLASLNCTFCSHKVPRRQIEAHQTKCTNRPFNCRYCNECKSSFSDVMNNHWPVCGSFPVSCPNQCGSTILRQDIDSHVADVCPLTTINCDFHHVGCAVKLPRQDMPEHLRENLLTHISLLATSHAKQQAETTQQRKEITKQQDKINRIEDENDTLKSKHKNLQHNYQALETNHQELKIEVNALKHKLHHLQNGGAAELAQPIQEAAQQINSKISIPLGPPVMSMTNVEQHKNGDLWYSPPVYTHHQGYKICLKVEIQPWGSQSHNAIVYIHFMKGAFDDFLTWPFRGSVSIRMVDQVKDQVHKYYKPEYTNEEDNDYSSKVVSGDVARYGKEVIKIMIYDKVETKYLRNNTLVFQIYEVELYH